VVVGALNGRQLMILFEELVGINNEQPNAFRFACKDLIQHVKLREEQENQIFDDMTEVNNE